MGIDLTTNYGGLLLKSPLIVGSCPMTAHEVTRIALMTSGAGALVLPSLLAQQIVDLPDSTDTSSTEGNNTPPKASPSYTSPKSYLEMVARANSQLSIPVIASLAGPCHGKWLDFAVELETAGASAIELSIWKPSTQSHVDPREIEDSIVEVATRLDATLSIPLFLKLTRDFTNISHLASRLQSTTQGLVLFGRYPETDIQLDYVQLTNHWGLTEAGAISQSIRPIMEVRDRCPNLSLAACGGIGTACDVAKTILAGADAAMVTSAVYRDGPSIIGMILDGLLKYLERQCIPSLEHLKTLGPKLPSPSNHKNRDQENPIPVAVDSTPEAIARTIQCDRWGHPKVPR